MRRKTVLSAFVIISVVVGLFVYLRLTERQQPAIDAVVTDDAATIDDAPAIDDYIFPEVTGNYVVTFSQTPSWLRGENTATVETADSSFYFHFAEGIDPAGIQETLARYISVFYAAGNVFPSDSFSILIDRELIQHSRVRYNTSRSWRREAEISIFMFNRSVSSPGFLTYLFFRAAFQVDLPAWLCVGLEDFLMGSGTILSEAEMSRWLRENTANVGFGDYWFVRQFRHPCEMPRKIAYTLVRNWYNAGILHEKVALAQEDRYAFAEIAADYSEAFSYTRDEDAFLFFYRFGDIEVSTANGVYVFKADTQWESRWVRDFVNYADAGSDFLREFFQVSDTRRARTHIHPSTIPLRNYFVPRDSRDYWLFSYGFAYGNIGVIGHADRSIFVHELAHVYMMRVNRPPAWLEEGMAVFAEIKWFTSEANPHPPRSHRYSNLNNTVVENSSFAPLPHIVRSGPESLFLTYEDGGSFVLFLYTNFGMEKLLQFYATPWAEIVFGYTLEQLIYEWQLFLISDVARFTNTRGDWWQVVTPGQG